jgi:hypothetical protein
MEGEGLLGSTQVFFQFGLAISARRSHKLLIDFGYAHVGLGTGFC